MSIKEDRQDILGKGRGGKQVKVPDDKRADIVALYKEKRLSERGIAEIVGISRGGVRSVLATEGIQNYFAPETVASTMALLEGDLSAEDVAEKLNLSPRTVYTIAYYHREQEKLKPAPNVISKVIQERMSIGRKWKPGRYMVICDLHILFHNETILLQCLSTKGDFDGCIIAGDFIDEYWISHFRKEGFVPQHKELVAGAAIMDMLVKRFGRVLFLPGNHEDRRFKQLLEAATPLAGLADEKADGIYKAIEKMRNWYYNEMPDVTVHNNWWATICNERIVIAHPDRFVATPGNAAKGVVEHFFNHRQSYKLLNLDAMLMGHGHRLDNLKHRLGIWTCELPCLCGILPYQSGSKASSAGSIDTGYFILTTRRNGELWFNESRAVLLEPQET